MSLWPPYISLRQFDFVYNPTAPTLNLKAIADYISTHLLKRFANR
jgi:hypothetical protein